MRFVLQEEDMVKRKKNPKNIEAEILLSSARRCALCYGLYGDLGKKKGQIAHINKDSSNANEANLVYLCLDHHDEYDSTTSQTKNVTSRELAAYKQHLLLAVKNGKHIKSEASKSKETYKVSSKNQTGGITAGNIDTININTLQASGRNLDINQLKIDEHIALLYQTEISHFLQKFKTCLHWTLPLGDNADNEIDAVFNYGINIAKAVDCDKLSKDLVTKIFSKYDFAKPMANYSGENNFRPTGFNNFIGIMKYLDLQIEKHLNKYGSSTSSELTSRIEYMQRMVQSTITSIRFDLGSNNSIAEQTVSLIADLIFLMCEDFNLMKKNYTKDITGGYPVLVGKVIKSHNTNGKILVETQFSDY
jgi:hypothetical protein